MANEAGIKPLDGSVMLLEREIGQIAYYPNQTRKFDLKLQPNLVKCLLLHFRGEAVSVGDDIFISTNTGPYPFIKNIQVRASNGVILKTIYPPALHLLNSMERASEELWVQNYSFYPEYWYSFSFDLIIPFENHTGFLPERTILNTNEFSEIGIYITWGNPNDIPLADYAEPALTLQNVVCDIVALERVPLSMEDELLNRQRMVDTMQEKVVTQDGEIVTFDLPENSLVKTLLFYVEKKYQNIPEVPPPEGTCFYHEPYENGIVRARVEDNNGAHIIREMSGYQMQSMMRSYYGLEGAMPPSWERVYGGMSNPHTQKTGVYCIEFDKLHDFTSLYSTIGVNYPKLILEVGDLQEPGVGWPTTYKVILLQRQIITPASTTA